MKTVWGIIGAVCFVVAVVFGYFFKFDASTPIAIAAAAFGFTAVVIGAITEGKQKNIKTWVLTVVIVLAAVGGCLCCIGGMNQSIFAEISGAALALIAVIFGIFYAKKTA